MIRRECVWWSWLASTDSDENERHCVDALGIILLGVPVADPAAGELEEVKSGELTVVADVGDKVADGIVFDAVETGLRDELLERGLRPSGAVAVGDLTHGITSSASTQSISPWRCSNRSRSENQRS